MTNIKIISEQPVAMARLREELKMIKERDTELNFRAARTEEYLNIFAALSSEKAEELCTKLKELKIPRLKDEHIVKIADTLPASIEELKTILVGYTITISNENCKKIIDITSEYQPKA